MNRLHIFPLVALAVASLSSCEPDDSPMIQKPTEFVLNTPPFSAQLYQLKPGNNIELTCSQPDYGLTLAPSYTVELSIHSDFGASLPTPEPGDEADAIPGSVTLLPDDPFGAVILLKEAAVSDAILAMRGIADEEAYTPYVGPLYIRAIASINSQAITTITSNTVTLSQVADYFSLVPQLPVLYVPGNSNGWNQEASMKLQGYGQDEDGTWIKFRGLTYLNGEFKFTTAPDWNGVNLGSDTDQDAAPAVSSGSLSDNDVAKNLALPEQGAGLYFADVNIKTMTFSLTFVSQLGLVGDFQGWDTNSAVPLMPSADYKTWSASADFAEGGGFKIVINGPTSGWALNYGGPADEMTMDGPNMSISGGSHTVTFSLDELPYKTTIE